VCVCVTMVASDGRTEKDTHTHTHTRVHIRLRLRVAVIEERLQRGGSTVRSDRRGWRVLRLLAGGAWRRACVPPPQNLTALAGRFPHAPRRVSRPASCAVGYLASAPVRSTTDCRSRRRRRHRRRRGFNRYACAHTPPPPPPQTHTLRGRVIVVERTVRTVHSILVLFVEPRCTQTSKSSSSSAGRSQWPVTTPRTRRRRFPRVYPGMIIYVR